MRTWIAAAVRSRLVLAAGTSVVLLAPRLAAAQVMQLQGGSSSLFGAHGGSVEINGARSSVVLGVGVMQSQLAIGARVETRVGRARIALGDDTVDFQLPTDSSPSGRFVPIRGVGVTVADQRFRISAFTGTSSIAAGSPFFRGYRSDHPVGLFSIELSRNHWTFASRTAVASQPTSIQSVAWAPRKDLRFATSAGIGVGKPFAAIAGHLSQRKADLFLGYSAPALRRLAVTTPLASETERENLRLMLRPLTRLSLVVTREHMIDANSTAAGSQSRATVNQLSASVNLGPTRFVVGGFQTARGADALTGASATVGQRLGSWLDVGAEYFRSRSSADGAIDESINARLREDLGPRLSLLQVATYKDRNLSANVGGRLLANLATIDVGYQTIYAPFSKEPFVHAMTLDVRVQIGGLQLVGSSYVAPDGNVRYTISGRQIRARNRASGPPKKTTMGKYLVRGRVVDDADRPLAGAALAVADEYLITDMEGRFQLRADHNRPMPIRVLLEEFLLPGLYEVVETPKQLTPRIDAAAEEARVVVRRR